MTAELIPAPGAAIETSPRLTPESLEWTTRFGWSIPKATTREAYRGDLGSLVRWLNEQRPGHPIDLLALTRTVLDTWRNAMVEAGLAPNTIARRLTGVSSFLSFLVDEDVLAENVALKVKRPVISSEGTTPALTPEEARRYLAAAEADTPRSHVLIAILLTTGLRISEVLGIDWEHIHQDQGHTVVHVTRKGGKLGKVVLAPVVVRGLDRLPHRDGPIIRDGYNLRASRSTVQCGLDRLAKVADLPGGHFHPHMGRATTISALLELHDVQRVQVFAAHSSPATTVRYWRRRDSLDRSLVHAMAGILAGE